MKARSSCPILPSFLCSQSRNQQKSIKNTELTRGARINCITGVSVEKHWLIHICAKQKVLLIQPLIYIFLTLNIIIVSIVPLFYNSYMREKNFSEEKKLVLYNCLSYFGNGGTLILPRCKTESSHMLDALKTCLNGMNSVGHLVRHNT